MAKKKKKICCTCELIIEDRYTAIFPWPKYTGADITRNAHAHKGECTEKARDYQREKGVLI